MNDEFGGARQVHRFTEDFRQPLAGLLDHAKLVEPTRLSGTGQ